MWAGDLSWLQAGAVHGRAWVGCRSYGCVLQVIRHDRILKGTPSAAGGPAQYLRQRSRNDPRSLRELWISLKEKSESRPLGRVALSDENRKLSAFVIQTFDSAKFDRRYQETIRPGIVKGGAEPRRADEILGVQPIIQKIEQAISAADICIAEVSVDNPNVWLELGYALALNRPTIILCDRHLRERLPFDVQHRPVIFYTTESRSGYEELEDKLAAEIRNLAKLVETEASQPILQSGATDAGDLKGYEVSVLAALLAAWSSSPSGVSSWDIERKLERAGYTDTQLAMGLSRLMGFGYVEQQSDTDDRDGSPYFAYRITPQGIKWIHQNEAAIKPAPARPARRAPTLDGFADDDIPF